MKKLIFCSSLILFGVACTSNFEVQESGKDGITRNYTLKINQNNQALTDYLIRKEKETLFAYLDEELKKNNMLLNMPTLELIQQIEEAFPVKDIENRVLDFHKTFFPQLQITSLTNDSLEKDKHLYPLLRYKLLSEYILEKFISVDKASPANIPILKLSFIYLFKRLSLKGKKIGSRQKKKEMRNFEEIFSSPSYTTFIQNFLDIKSLNKGLKQAKKNTIRYSSVYGKINIAKIYSEIKK